MTLDEILSLSPVIPVLTIRHADHAEPLAGALSRGGLRVLEVTLRTPVALEAIRRIKAYVENVIVGAGTVMNRADHDAAQKVGAAFTVSPALADDLLVPGGVPHLPGIATPSELLRGLDAGLRHFKFFPAAAFGGLEALKAFAGPFPSARFCATGGITAANAQDFLDQKNVVCVGGAWVASPDAIEAGDWRKIEELARQASRLRVNATVRAARDDQDRPENQQSGK
jgi:2-dehydro-3-deoxyphosphogluconate aldolase/(4S)-4-hydroxy-2-oxoglutarate aldolase